MGRSLICWLITLGGLYGTLLDMLVNYFAINLFFFGRFRGGLYGTLLDMLVNYFAINLFFFGRFRDAPIFTIDCIRYVNI